MTLWFKWIKFNGEYSNIHVVFVISFTTGPSCKRRACANITILSANCGANSYCNLHSSVVFSLWISGEMRAFGKTAAAPGERQKPEGESRRVLVICGWSCSVFVRVLFRNAAAITNAWDRKCRYGPIFRIWSFWDVRLSPLDGRLCLSLMRIVLQCNQHALFNSFKFQPNSILNINFDLALAYNIAG